VAKSWTPSDKRRMHQRVDQPDGPPPARCQRPELLWGNVTSPPPRARWLQRLLAYCLGHRRDLFVAFGAAIGGAVVSTAVPLAIRHVIDTAATP